MNHQHIGVCFTPETWCRWLLQQHQVLDAWLQGAKICDPTAGQGAFILALCQMAVDGGHLLTPQLISNLFLNEAVPEYLQQFQQEFQHRFHIAFPASNLFCQDVILAPPPLHCHILVGNPPWVNFTDLPTDYKEQLKPYFIKEHLVPSGKALLLGGCRTDIAALVLNTALDRLLLPNGLGYFFLPQSLFFGDVAHEGFRRFCANGRPFQIEALYDFHELLNVFPHITTAYCAAAIKMDSPHRFPVHFHHLTTDGVTTTLLTATAPASTWQDATAKVHIDYPFAPCHRPRQGVNTCGANSIFIFDAYPDFLEPDLLYPLVDKQALANAKPKRWILIPHDITTGKPLSWEQISPKTQQYLLKHRSVLENRKGTLLRNFINKKHWWALLGVGPYSFAPFKVIWEAYGMQQFAPKVLSNVNGQPWQGNQALHAYIPCDTLREATEIQQALIRADLTSILKAQHSAGKCNWAQPGKIWRILSLPSKACAIPQKACAFGTGQELGIEKGLSEKKL